jgi:hypothetical protein
MIFSLGGHPMYEKQLANKFFNAQVRAKRMNVTGDIMTRDSQVSAGYWEIVQDALADLVRIMLVRCFDEENHKLLYDHCRNLRGQVWLVCFPKPLYHHCTSRVEIPQAVFPRAIHGLHVCMRLHHVVAHVLHSAVYVDVPCQSLRAQVLPSL